MPDERIGEVDIAGTKVIQGTVDQVVVLQSHILISEQSLDDVCDLGTSIAVHTCEDPG